MQIRDINIGREFTGGIDQTKKNTGSDFSGVLKNFINDVNAKQHDSMNKTEEFIQGGNIEVHDVMIAGEKAKTSIELLMQIRNKTLDMYKEISRMQI